MLKAFSGFFILVALFLLTSCGKDKIIRPQIEEEPISYVEYLPLISGSEYIYKIDSINQKILGTDTISFYMRVQIQDTTTNVSGNEIIPYLYETSENVQGPWKKLYQGFYAIQENEIIQQYDNILYVKLSTPVLENREFDANAYNITDTFKFRKSIYSEVHQPLTTDFTTFDSTIYIQLENFVTPFSEEIEFERYAWKVGLIERVFRNLDLQKNPVEGFIVNQKLVSYKIP